MLGLEDPGTIPGQRPHRRGFAFPGPVPLAPTRVDTFGQTRRVGAYRLGRPTAPPALVAVHHPPVPVGIPFLDGIRLLDADALADVVGAHPQVVRVLCGHVHRGIAAPFAGTLTTTAPSTYRQSALDMTAPGTMGYLDERTSVLLHQLTDATAGICITHTVPVTGAAATHFTIPAR